uniref:Dephospho-CoA kinase n=1 Tax=Streptomyces sp. NBC_01393 TaxID=2903851 RepID=A0AAU3I6W1_9ACTN
MNTATAPVDDDTEIILSWLPQYIGLHGHAGVGKDSVAKILETYGYTPVAFADRLREALYILNPLIEEGYGGVEYRIQDLVDNFGGWDSVKRKYPEVRRLLQVLGTEVGREMISQNVWVDSVFKTLEEDKKYVFTDVRFVNEHQAVDSRLGLLIKINRPGTEPANDHTSEQDLPNQWFDATIVNDGTLEDLNTKVRDILRLA